MLRAIRRSMDNLTEEIKALDEEITLRMQPFEEEITHLCQIPGISKTSAKDLLAEIGVSMEVFPSSAHLASWAGVSPGNNESAGKKKLAYEPWQQADESGNHRVRMGGKPYQEDIFLTALQETGSTQGQKESPGGIGPRDTEDCVPCLERQM